MKTTNVDDVPAARKRLGMPGTTARHTARIGNYVIEGHVPAADVKRPLRRSRQPSASPPRHARRLARHGKRPARPYEVLLVDYNGSCEHVWQALKQCRFDHPPLPIETDRQARAQATRYLSQIPVCQTLIFAP